MLGDDFVGVAFFGPVVETDSEAGVFAGGCWEGEEEGKENEESW